MSSQSGKTPSPTVLARMGFELPTKHVVAVGTVAIEFPQVLQEW